MTKQELLQNIADIDGGLKSSLTPESLKPELLSLKAEFEAKLKALDNAPAPAPKEKVSAAKKIAASVVKKPKAEKAKKVPAAKKGESKEDILQNIADIEAGLKSSLTPESLKADLKALKAEFEAKLKDFDSAPAVKEKVSAAKKIAASVVKKAKVAPVKKERVAKVKKEKVVKAVVSKKAAKEPVKKKNILEDCKEILKTFRKKKQHDKERAEDRAKKGKPAKLTPSETIAKSAAAVKTKVIDIKEAKKGISQSEISKITNSIVSTVSSTLSGIIEVVNKQKFIKGLVSELRSLEDGISKNKKVSGAKYEHGGEMESVGVDLFEDYENIPADVQEVLDRHQDDFMDGSYDGLGQALDELEPLGYTFDFGLDGGAYDLRKIGQRGKSEDMEYAVGGRTSRGIARDRMFISHQEHEKRYKRKTAGKRYESGGELENENAESLLMKVDELNHHLSEIKEIVSENTEVEPWVLNRAQRAATDLSDITHYLESESKEHEGSMEHGGFFAEGGQVDFAQLSNIHRNIMGTISFDLKIKGMRKPQDFIVYPISAGESNKSIMIQSDTRIGKIDLIGGVGVMSQSHSGGAYFMHLSLDKKTVFKLSDADLDTLKVKISGTAGDRVGSMGISSDNSGASMMAGGGYTADGYMKSSEIKLNTKEEAERVAKSLAENFGKAGRNFKVEKKGDIYVVTYEFNMNGIVRYGVDDVLPPEGYADGGVMAKGARIEYTDNIATLKREALDDTDWDKFLREYAGNEYSGLTKMEKEEIIRQEQRERERDDYADGGQTGQQELFLGKGGDCYGCGGEMDKMAKGGATFSDKVESISKRLEGSKVPSRLRDEYGEEYNKPESISAAKRIAGSILAKSKRK